MPPVALGILVAAVVAVAAMTVLRMQTATVAEPPELVPPDPGKKGGGFGGFLGKALLSVVTGSPAPLLAGLGK